MAISEISIDKIYKTRVGSNVVIYSTTNGGDYPIHGAYEAAEDVWRVAAWRKDGLIYEGQIRSLDIVMEA